jgi:capsular exopolysaccharide synthesis family protein
LPILGIIPKVDEPIIDLNITTTRKSYSYYSSFTEGLRSLAMNLRYLVTETGRIKTLAVTSSTSAEGKTTVTYNLGLVLAEFGLRVLVVDADLRKPKIHKLANLSNETGLTELITTDRSWLDTLSINDTFENLHIIPSGSTAPNPIALLNSEKMSQLILQWQEAYDYVLIDTPPIGVIADAKSLANQVDTILFVAGIERASRKALANSLDILYSSRCNLAGIVANLVDPQFDYYAYSYYDSYYNQTNRNNKNNNDDENDGIKNALDQFRRR